MQKIIVYRGKLRPRIDTQVIREPLAHLVIGRESPVPAPDPAVGQDQSRLCRLVQRSRRGLLLQRPKTSAARPTKVTSSVRANGCPSGQGEQTEHRAPGRRPERDRFLLPPRADLAKHLDA